jgi:N-acetylglucosaminyldiphosphoundecaprenol N-acetyl-beta-D-mannosaminyltransferase
VTTTVPAPVPARPPALLFGVPIDDVTMAETIDAIDELVRVGRERGTSHQVATVNVDFLVNALADTRLRTILQQADLNIADGMPLLWACRLLGTPLRERVAGSDLVQELAAHAAERGWTIHFFGSAAGIGERAVQVLRDRHPGARLTSWSGPMIPDPDEVDDDVIEHIAAERADILCVALGNPKQERFIASTSARLRVPVTIGIGGSLDMLVGERKRAPEWAQRSGLEWVFRAAQEPARLGRRYAHDARVFFPQLAAHLRDTRHLRTGWSLGPATAGGDDVDLQIEAAPADRDPTWTTISWNEGAQRIAAGQRIEVRLHGARLLTGSALAQLGDLLRRARRYGATVRIAGAQPTVDEQLADIGQTDHPSG